MSTAAGHTRTVHMYDLNGKEIAKFEGVHNQGYFINGRIIIISDYSTVLVVDGNGKILTEEDTGVSLYYLQNNGRKTCHFLLKKHPLP